MTHTTEPCPHVPLRAGAKADIWQQVPGRTVTTAGLRSRRLTDSITKRVCFWSRDGK